MATQLTNNKESAVTVDRGPSQKSARTENIPKIFSYGNLLSISTPFLRVAMLTVAVALVFFFGLVGFMFLFACYLACNLAIVIYRGIRYAFVNEVIDEIRKWEERKNEQVED